MFKKTMVITAVILSFALGIGLGVSGILDIPATAQAATPTPRIVRAEFDKPPAGVSWSYVGRIELDRPFNHISHDRANKKVIIYFSVK